MTDYSELIEELREQARLEDEYPEDAIIKRRAADALEAQAKEIAELEADIDRNDEWARGFIEKTDARIAELEAENAKFRAAMEPVSLWSFEAQDGTPAIQELHDDIMRIRAALKGEK
jgi:DNA repair exonuclease SbcCD ATPase subunit